MPHGFVLADVAPVDVEPADLAPVDDVIDDVVNSVVIVSSFAK